MARHGLYAPDVDAGFAEILNPSSPERVSPPGGGPGGRFKGEAQLGSCMYNGLDDPALGNDPEVGGREEWEAPRERASPQCGQEG